jgi:hypothetical protein
MTIKEAEIIVAIRKINLIIESTNSFLFFDFNVFWNFLKILFLAII